MQWELRGDRPIYQQLVEKLTEQIVSGQLAAGEKVPPVRELAAQAGVNPNTMQRAHPTVYIVQMIKRMLHNQKHRICTI